MLNYSRFIAEGMYKKAIASAVAVGLVVLVVILAGLSGYLFISNSSIQGNLNTANLQVTSLNSRVTTLQTSVTSLNSQVSSLSSQNLVLNSNVSSLEQQKISLTLQITSLNENISTLEQEKTAIETQLASAQNNASSLQMQLNQIDKQVSSLENRVSTLESIVNLRSSVVELSSQSFTTGTSGNVSVITFAANYTGYILVSDSSASDYSKEGIATLQQFSSSVQSGYSGIFVPAYGTFYLFSQVNDALAIPVSAGTVTVYLETADTTAQTATLSVTYYY